MFEINGPFFFGAVSKFRDAMRIIEESSKSFNYTECVMFLQLMEQEFTLSKKFIIESIKIGTQLVLSGVHTQPLMALSNPGFLKVIGEKNVLGNIDDSYRSCERDFRFTKT